MKTQLIEISPDFKENLQKAIFSIRSFMFIYLLLLLGGVLITILSIALGIGIMSALRGLIPLLLGIGVISMGIFILMFLVKFMFKKNIVDSSHLVEITAEDEPQLFKLIQEIVEDTKTQFPKKVYLSARVNAAVFYDSSFWSMFFPIEKNLEIGLGLVNGVTQNELKAILAHEFGHFSQSSMKVGSYVYHVNMVIHNLLYENESYQQWVKTWSDLTVYFAFFMNIAVGIIQSIQWILKKMYKEVNISYKGLSRSMEFHADEIAAHVAGSAPMMSALARIEFVDFVFQDVLNHYGRKISEGVKTQNVYPQHHLAMQFWAKEIKLPIKNELPEIDLYVPNPFNRSQLVVKDQWASHPSTPDRIKALETLNIQLKGVGDQLANQLFQKLAVWQSQLTDMLFASPSYMNAPQVDNLADFQEEYIKNYQLYSFDALYNHYYDQHNPLSLSIEELLAYKVDSVVDEVAVLFDPEAIDLMYSMVSLEKDLLALQYIQRGENAVQSIDYAGQKYTTKEITELFTRLEQDLQMAKRKIQEHDLNIFGYFHHLALQQNRATELLLHYRQFIEYNRVFEQHKLMAQDMMRRIQFLQENTSFEQIESNFFSLKPLEIRFKTSIAELLAAEIHQPVLSEVMAENFKQYLSKEWVYFVSPQYQEDAIVILITSIGDYTSVVQDTYLNLKKTLLNVQVQLEKDKR